MEKRSKRYGGTYSTQGATSSNRSKAAKRRQPRDRNAKRVGLMFIPPIPLFFMSLTDPAQAMATGLAGCGFMLGGAYLVQEGLKAESAFKARKIARPPAFPRKIFGALSLGIGVVFAALESPSSLLSALPYGVIASGLALITFGLDPMRAKGIAREDSFQSDRVLRALDKAGGYLDEMERAIAKTSERALSARLAAFRETASEIFAVVEADPSDLTAARKFLGIYLLGARDATLRFAELYANTPDPAARSAYLALLDDLEASFEAKKEKLLTADRTELDIEIDVLRDRLTRDGLLQHTT